jgi:hypothetical protein
LCDAAPPKALDEEDVEFYEELSKRKAEMDAKLSVEEEQMLAAYRAARSSASVTETPTIAPLNPKPKPQQKKGNGSTSKPAATIGESLWLENSPVSRLLVLTQP